MLDVVNLSNSSTYNSIPSLRATPYSEPPRCKNADGARRFLQLYTQSAFTVTSLYLAYANLHTSLVVRPLNHSFVLVHTKLRQNPQGMMGARAATIMSDAIVLIVTWRRTWAIRAEVSRFALSSTFSLAQTIIRDGASGFCVTASRIADNTTTFTGTVYFL